MGDHQPQDLVGVEQPDLQPSEASAHAPNLAGMGEYDFLFKLKRNGRHEIKEFFTLPAVTARIVDFDVPIVTGTDHKLAVHPGDLGKDFLVIESRIPDKPQFLP